MSESGGYVSSVNRVDIDWYWVLMCALSPNHLEKPGLRKREKEQSVHTDLPQAYNLLTPRLSDVALPLCLQSH